MRNDEFWFWNLHHKLQACAQECHPVYLQSIPLWNNFTEPREIRDCMNTVKDAIMVVSVVGS